MILPPIPFQPTISRRGLLAGAGSFAALVATGTAAGARLPGLHGWLGPVVSFHADAPYVDQTGLARPFHARISTAWADGLDREALLRLGQTI